MLPLALTTGVRAGHPIAVSPQVPTPTLPEDVQRVIFSKVTDLATLAAVARTSRDAQAFVKAHFGTRLDPISHLNQTLDNAVGFCGGSCLLIHLHALNRFKNFITVDVWKTIRKRLCAKCPADFMALSFILLAPGILPPAHPLRRHLVTQLANTALTSRFWQEVDLNRQYPVQNLPHLGTDVETACVPGAIVLLRSEAFQSSSHKDYLLQSLSSAALFFSDANKLILSSEIAAQWQPPADLFQQIAWSLSIEERLEALIRHSLDRDDREGFFQFMNRFFLMDFPADATVLPVLAPHVFPLLSAERAPQWQDSAPARDFLAHVLCRSARLSRESNAFLALLPTLGEMGLAEGVFSERLWDSLVTALDDPGVTHAQVCELLTPAAPAALQSQSPRLQ